MFYSAKSGIHSGCLVRINIRSLLVLKTNICLRTMLALGTWIHEPGTSREVQGCIM